MMKYTDLDHGIIETTFNLLGGLEGVARFHRGELVLVEAPKPKPPLEPVLDFLVRVNRTKNSAYLDWADKLISSELELTGPAEYDLQTVLQWLANGQESVIKGHHIYTQLKKKNALENCLGLADLLAIQQKGIAVFRKLFAEKVVFGWRSVIQDRDGRLCAPYLRESGNGKIVLLFWRSLSNRWNTLNPALRFGK